MERCSLAAPCMVRLRRQFPGCDEWCRDEQNIADPYFAWQTRLLSHVRQSGIAYGQRYDDRIIHKCYFRALDLIKRFVSMQVCSSRNHIFMTGQRSGELSWRITGTIFKRKGD
jgi:hypothetical protein